MTDEARDCGAILDGCYCDRHQGHEGGHFCAASLCFSTWHDGDLETTPQP